MRIVLDANILFCASLAGSPTARVVDLSFDRAEVVTCDYAIEEARRNIELKRSAWANDFAALLKAVEVAPTQVFALPVNLAEKDVPILCSAIRAGCDHLVTSDKQDFGHLYGQRVQGVLIISLLQLANILIGADLSPPSPPHTP